MMSRRVSISQKRKEAPEWIFPWRPVADPLFPKWLAVAFAAVAFAFLAASIRIRTVATTPWAARKASVIHVLDDAAGRALTQQAREGGPFPSRFDPKEWEGAAALEDALVQAAHRPPPPYVPALRDLPRDETPRITLAAKGTPVLPKRSSGKIAPPATTGLRLTPVLHPLSGITPAAMPDKLPPFPGPGEVSAEPWRFLIRLDAAGRVLDVVSLDGTAPASLLDWLRGVAFAPDSTRPTRWISIGVGFINQAADGTDAR